MGFLPPIPPLILWSGFVAMIVAMLLADLIIFHKRRHIITVKEALAWTGVWISLALLFNLFVWLEFGHEAALQFLTGYLIEKSLSVDNLFVILLIFASLKIEERFQHEVLFWGIIGALFMRGSLIIVGTALVERFHWVLYVFGVFLLYAAYKLLVKRDDNFDPRQSWIVRMTSKVVPVWKDHQNGAFVQRKNGRFAITILFVALLVIEFTDLVFAFDSIPAIFAVTTNPFIIFTSNIFAILGLRSLYFVIARINDLFEYLNIGLAIVLAFIGCKMLFERWIHIPILLSLAIIVSVLAAAMTLSVSHQRRVQREEERARRRSIREEARRRIARRAERLPTSDD